MRMKLVAIGVVLAIISGLIVSNQAWSGDRPKPKNPSAEKKPAPKPVTLKGQLNSSDPLDFQRSSSYHKIHKLKLKKGVMYSFTMSANYRPYLRIEDFRGNQVAFTNRIGGNTVTVEYAPKEDENYRIVATSYTRSTGTYTINIKPMVPIALIQDKLTRNDKFDTRRPRCYAKVHKIKLKAGNTYVIHAKTTLNDGWLRLEDSQKRNLMENDDWMNTRNSRLVFRATKTDTYRLICTTCGSGTIGPYTVTVTKQ